MGDRCETCGQVIAPTWETDPVEVGTLRAEVARLTAELDDWKQRSGLQGIALSAELDEVHRLDAERDELRRQLSDALRRLDDWEPPTTERLRQAAIGAFMESCKVVSGDNVIETPSGTTSASGDLLIRALAAGAAAPEEPTPIASANDCPACDAYGVCPTHAAIRNPQ